MKIRLFRDMFQTPALVGRRACGAWAFHDQRRLGRSLVLPGPRVGTSLGLLLVATAWLVGRPLTAQADETESWYCYAPEGDARPVPCPTETSVFNCLLPENSGGYVAVWDDGANNNVIIEHQSATNTQTWRRDLSLATDESTRVVLASINRVLWCSAQRWVFLDRDTGTNVSTGSWDHPLLAAEKIIIREDIMYVIKEETTSCFDTNIIVGSDEDLSLMVAYRFDTNMTALGTVFVAAPQGLWASYAGSWLLDLSSRSSHSIRVVSIATGAQTEIPLPTDVEDGYTEHRVLSANADTMFVVSSINWPTTTLHYFTLFDGNGVIFQNRMSCQESITGATPMPNGWLLSARSLGETTPGHYLFRVDPDGAVHAQLRIRPSAPQNYIALNTEPPRVLHVIDARNLEIIEVAAKPWWYWWLDGSVFLTPNVEVLHPSERDAPIGSTSSFWLTPICPNTK